MISDDSTRNLISDLNRTYQDPVFLFDVMINTLEIKGQNEKEDRMEGGATMSSSMCLVSCILFGVCKAHHISCLSWVCLCGILGFAATYAVYIRFRYSTAVRTYWILTSGENNRRNDNIGL